MSYTNDGTENGNGAAAPSGEAAAASDRNQRGRFVPGNRAAARRRVAPESATAIEAQLAARFASSPLPGTLRDLNVSELSQLIAEAQLLIEPMRRYGLMSERGRRRPAYVAYLALMERAAQIIELLDPPSKRGGKRRVDPQQALAELRALAERKA